MYHHPGEYVTDFCIVRRDETYHLFHIRGERWTWPVGYREIDLGHATSTDMRSWTPQTPVLGPGGAGAWDETGVWAPDIIQHEGIYYLFYTGSDAHNNQSIGFATSTDLMNWTTYEHNPVVAPGPWSDIAVGQDVACRDGMVFADAPNGRFLMYYTATMADGRACLALAQSRDLVTWEDLGPTYLEEDRSYNRCESPYLVEHEGSYYLFYSAKGGPKSKGFRPDEFAHFDIVYLVSNDPTGGWTKPENHLLIEGQTCASEHPTFDGETFMFYIIQEEMEGIWGASVLSDPRRIVWQPDGTLRVEEYLPPTLVQRPLFDHAAGFAAWVAHGGAWREDDGALIAPGAAHDCYLMHTLWGDDLTFEADVYLEAGASASLLVRANPSAMAGYRVSIDASAGSVGLFVKIPGAPDRLVQQRFAPVAPDQWHTLRVVLANVFIEVFLDGALLLVHDLHSYAEGCFGLHAHGAARFRNVRALTDDPPADRTPPWSRRCLPRHLS